MTCFYLILLTTKGICGFSSLCIEFCCGAVFTVFTLLEFAAEFEFGIDMIHDGM